MMTRILAAAAALTVASGAAFAADLPNQDPFRNWQAGRAVQGTLSFADPGSAQYPDPAGFPTFSPVAPLPLPAPGSERIVESANSLPRGFERGMPGYSQALSMRQGMERAGGGVPGHAIWNAGG